MMVENKYNEIITTWLETICRDFKQTNELLEQKEELKSDIVDRILDYMKDNNDFEEAFILAKRDLGDLNILLQNFEKNEVRRSEHSTPPKKRCKISFGFSGLIALAPFIYIALGVWFGWWAWGWMIIPLSAIWLEVDDIRHKIVASSPFIYLILGFWFGLWAWGWVIIPISAIIFETPFIKISKD